MEFLDNKEEVIHFELTPFGKRQFANGKLKPVYYSFSDSDIIYDSAFASLNETQNQSHPRIYDDTARISQNLGKNGTVEKEYDLSGSYRQREYINLLGTLRTHSSQSSNLNFVQLDGTLDGVTTKQQGYYEVTSSIHYEVKVSKNSRFKTENEQYLKTDSDDVEQDTIFFEDGSNLRMIQDFFILKLEEENVEFSKQNFDIKIFDLDDGQYVNLEDNQQINLFLDSEIPTSIICPLISKEKTKDIFQDKIFDCQDEKQNRMPTNIYNNLEDFKGIC